MDILTSDYAPLFTIPAVAGSFFFLMRLVLMLIGAGIGDEMGGHDVGGGHDMGGGHDIGAGHDFDAGGEDLGTHDHHQGDSTDAFKVLSIQTIAGFVMGFGWGGLGAYRGLDWPVATSFLCAIGGGVLIVWILAMLFKSIGLLSASGNIRIQEAVGCTGSVYAGIPARGAGRGKVRLVVNDRARIYNAVSSGEELPRHARIKVVTVNRDNTVTVAPDTA